MIGSYFDVFNAKKVYKLPKSTDWNWSSLSIVMMRGTPKMTIQFPRSVLATVSAEISLIGYAAGHLEKRSIIVRR